MQDAAVKFNESLERRGKQLKDTEPSEIADLLRSGTSKLPLFANSADYDPNPSLGWANNLPSRGAEPETVRPERV